MRCFVFLYKLLKNIFFFLTFRLPGFFIFSINKSVYTRFGTKYGGWWLYAENLNNSNVLVSAGAGEDISFDLLINSNFGCQVYIIDPTPRAIKHFNSVSSRNNKEPHSDLEDNGAINPFNYDLRSVDFSKIKYIPLGLWNEKSQLKFYAPINPSHVSHSLNILPHVDQNSNALRVDVDTVSNIMYEYSILNIDVLKLDIEGAEVEVLNDILDSSLKPAQILVEYDELISPSVVSSRRISSIHKRLLMNGYKLGYREGTNCSYILSKLLSQS